MRKVVLYMLLSADGVAESPGNFVLDFDDRMRENLADVVTSTTPGVAWERTTVVTGAVADLLAELRSTPGGVRPGDRGGR